MLLRGFAHPLAKPQNCQKAYMLATMFDNAIAATSEMFYHPAYLVLDKIFATRYTSCSGTELDSSTLYSGEDLFKFEQSCTYAMETLRTLA